MKGFGKFMNRTPHMVSSKIGMAKSTFTVHRPSVAADDCELQVRRILSLTNMEASLSRWRVPSKNC